MNYRVELTAAVRREIKKLPRGLQEILIAKAKSLAANPLPSGAKKLQDSSLGTNLFRVRVGDFRIVYQVQKSVLVVLIVKIANRREAYKK